MLSFVLRNLRFVRGMIHAVIAALRSLRFIEGRFVMLFLCLGD